MTAIIIAIKKLLKNGTKKILTTVPPAIVPSVS